ncbi:outer membrane protein assembly factor BamE [Parvibaculaceae bacterium PLY_AMNH_Bact1]|nr:outer membrane protein assembly factor BamE [Parvibaculaceae bacterium PLY_AMNH_Bact1]
MRQRLAALLAPFKSAIFASIIGATALAGCSTEIDERGYIFDQEDFDRIKPGLTSEAEVTEILGSPSTIATVEGKTWFYISSTFEKLMFYTPEEVDRKVVAIYFDDTKTVEDVGYYGLEDGMIIDFRTRKTPTRGKELTVLGQIFGNLGRFNQNAPAQPGR